MKWLVLKLLLIKQNCTQIIPAFFHCIWIIRFQTHKPLKEIQKEKQSSIKIYKKKIAFYLVIENKI